MSLLFDISKKELTTIFFVHKKPSNIHHKLIFLKSNFNANLICDLNQETRKKKKYIKNKTHPYEL